MKLWFRIDPGARKSRTQKIGGAGEAQARAYFERKGWRLADRNWSCRAGELDLVFEQPDGTVVFVEVRFRSRGDYGLAQETVRFSKQSRLLKAALLYLKVKGWTGRGVRFDVAAVTPNGVEHIPNAFSSSAYSL